MATVETRFVVTGVGDTQAGCSSVARGISNVSTAANSTSSSLDHLSSSSFGLNSSLVQLLGSLRNILVAWLSLKQISDVFATAMKTALDYNKTLENSRLGIAAIITSMAGITDESGRQLQGQQKFNAAVQVAVSQQRQLEVIAMSTAATYQELVTVYQALLAPALAAKLTLGQTVTLTGLMTNSVKAMDLPMNQIVQESRDMLTGNIDNNSQLAKSLGITREMVKEWTTKRTLFDEITKRLEGFTYASREFENTWDGAVSNLKDALQKALGSGMQPLMRPLVGGVQAIANAFLDVDRNVDGTVKTIQVKRSLIETIYTYIANPLYKAWLVVQGAVETINSLFLQQNGVLRIVTDAVKIMLGWVVGIADGWGWIVSTVLPSVAAALGKVNEILTMMLVSAYDFGNLLLNAMRAVGESLGSVLKAAWQGITGDFKGAGETLAGIFKGKAVENMKGWSKELERTIDGLKTSVSGMGTIWDQFLDKTVAWQQGLKKDALPDLGIFGVSGNPGGAAKQTETDFNRTKAIGDAMRAWQEAYWAWEDAGHKAKAKSAIDTLQWQHEQGLKTTREYLDEKERLEKGVVEREIERNNKRIADMQSSLSITMGPGKDPNSDQALKHAQAQEQLIKALTKRIELEAQLEAIGNKAGIDREKDQIKKKDQLLAAEVALLNAQGQTVAATEKQIEADQRGRLQMDDKTKAVYEQIDALRVMKALFDEMNALSAITNQTDDINNSMISDPYERKRAQMEAAYAREMELINQKISLTESGSEKELALAEQGYALQIKLAEDLRKNQLDQSRASWDGVVAAAQAAFPKLTGIDKAIAALHRDYTIRNKEGVIDQTRTSLSMYSSYAGAVGAMFDGMAAAQDTSTRKGFESAKAYNIAAAVMSTAAGIMQQLAAPDGGLPTAWARAGLVAAMGAIQIAQIASTSYGGGGAASPSVPSGSFGGGGASGGSAVASPNTGIGNLIAPLRTVQDLQSRESMDRLIQSNDNVAVAIGRLSTGIDRLTALFSQGGAGYSLATNAPGRFAVNTGLQQVGPIAGTITGLINDASFKNGVLNGVLTWMSGGLFSVFSGIFGGLFGRENRLMGTGLSLAVTGGRVYAANYEDREQGSWWVGSRRNTYYSQNTAAADYLQALIAPLGSEIERMARTLGTSANLSAVNVGPVQIKTMGESAESISKQLEEWTLKVLQSMSMTVDGLKEMVGSYDDAYAKLREFNDALVSTNEAFALIGKDLVQGSLANGRFLAAVQQDLFGGLDKFRDAIDTYFGSLFTDTERRAAEMAQAQREIAATFGAVGLYIPRTREQFRLLVNSLDVTSEQGAATFAALMGVAEAFGMLMDEADRLADARRDMAQDLTARELRLAGKVAEATLYELQVEQANELSDAVEQGLDITRLRAVQEREYAAAMKASAAAAAEATKALLSASVSATQGILQTMRSLLTGPAAMLDPYTAYNQARAALGTADRDTVAQRAQEFVTAARSVAGSREQYDADYRLALNTLAAFAETTPTLSAVDRQIDLLDRIATAISDGNLEQLTALAGVQSLIASSALSATADTLGLRDVINSGSVAQILQLQDAVSSIYGSSAAQITTLQGITSTVAGGTAAQLAQLQAVISSIYGAGSAQVSATGGVSSEVAAGSTVQSTVLTGILSETSHMSELLARYLGEASGGSAVDPGDVPPIDTTVPPATLSPILVANALAMYEQNKAAARAQIEAEIRAANLPHVMTVDKNTVSWYDQNYYDDVYGEYGMWFTDTYWTDRYRSLLDKALADMDAYVAANRNSYAVGTAYVPYDQTADIHQGEIIMDRQVSDGLRKYGIRVQAAGAADNRELAELLKEVRDELREARREGRAGDAAIAERVDKAARILDRWNKEGQPPERAAA